MQALPIAERVKWVGAVDYDRTLFDSLIPIPEGTGYNSYLVQGSERTALIDTVEPSFGDVLMDRLQSSGVDRIDYIVINHAEQDHSGSLPFLMEMYRMARIVCSKRASEMLLDLLPIPSDRIQIVEDGETLSLGDRTLEFIHYPWVHWPETMLTYLVEDKILFPCDLFGSHMATNLPTGADPAKVLAQAKLYFAQIMMPFRKIIAKNFDAVTSREIDLIAPSHGPCHTEPSLIIDAYKEWLDETPKNKVTVVYTSMHESTRIMVDHLVDALAVCGITVEQFNMVEADSGRLAASLVDSATIVLGSPTVLGGLHPHVGTACLLANVLKPKAKWGAVVGSFGWSGKVFDDAARLLDKLKLEYLEPVLCKGAPRMETIGELRKLAERIAERHSGLK